MTMNNTPANPGAAAAGKSVAAAAPAPEVVKEAARANRVRRPMSAPQRRLECTPIPGFHLHWVREQNLPQAYSASYQHVLEDEVEINTRNVAVDGAVGATADLSNRVSVQYGGDTLWLMKLDESLYNEDMAILAAQNANIWAQIFRGEAIAGTQAQNPGDTSNAYVREAKAEGSDLNRAKKPLFDRKYKVKL